MHHGYNNKNFTAATLLISDVVKNIVFGKVWIKPHLLLANNQQQKNAWCFYFFRV